MSDDIQRLENIRTYLKTLFDSNKIYEEIKYAQEKKKLEELREHHKALNVKLNVSTMVNLEPARQLPMHPPLSPSTNLTNSPDLST